MLENWQIKINGFVYQRYHKIWNCFTNDFESLSSRYEGNIILVEDEQLNL